MALISKNIEVKRGFGEGIESSQVRSHANDSYVVKKVEEATKTIQKVGLPNQKKK